MLNVECSMFPTLALQSPRTIAIGWEFRRRHSQRMSVETIATNPQEKRAIICLCILAAFADGAQNETERARITAILGGFDEAQVDLTSAYQDALGGKLSLTTAAEQ